MPDPIKYPVTAPIDDFMTSATKAEARAAIDAQAELSEVEAGKSTIVDADKVPIIDSEDSDTIKLLSFANLWAWVKSKTDLLYVTLTGAQTIPGAKTFTSKTKVTASGTNDSQMSAGTLELQSYALGNSWIGDNVTFTSGSFRPVATGVSSLFYFAGTEGHFRFTASASAGSAITPLVKLKIFEDGTFATGYNINSSTGSTSNAKFIISPTGAASMNGSISFFNNSGTWNGAITTGEQSFTDQLEATGQAADTDDSLMTRELGRGDPFDFIQNQNQQKACTNPLVASGTAATAIAATSGFRLSNGTGNSGYAMVTVSDSPAGDFGSNHGTRHKFAMCFTSNLATATDRKAKLRFMIGGASTPTASDADALTDDGFGCEIEHDGTNHRIRAFAYDGAYSAGSWVNFATGNISSGVWGVVIEHDGAGNVTAKIRKSSSPETVHTSTLADLTLGSSTSNEVQIASVNDSTGVVLSSVYSIKDYLLQIGG